MDKLPTTVHYCTFKGQPSDFNIWLERLEKLREDLRQVPAQTPRVIELPDVTQSDQQIIPPHMPDTEMHDIFNADILDAPPRNAQNTTDVEISDVSNPSMEDISNREIHCVTYFGTQGLPSNDFNPLADVPMSPRSSTSNIQTIDSSQNIDNSALMAIDTDAFELVDPSLANTFQSPPFPITLTMELPMPVWKPGDVTVEWSAIDSSELHEGATLDLDTILDSSLWEDGSRSSPVKRNAVPLLEQSGTGMVI